MPKRARLAKLTAAAAVFVLVIAAFQAAAGAEGVQRFLLGWPRSPDPSVRAADDPEQPSVLAYQFSGPEYVLADIGRELAGAAGPQTSGALAGLSEQASAGAEAAVPAAALLTGNLAPKSPSAVLMEATSGRILFAKGENERRAIASVTKIMTLALIFDALESGRARIDEVVTTSANAAGMGGSQIWLEPGEQMTLREMILAIAVGSANDASLAVAEHLYGTHERFVEAMNNKAAELGMTNTHFVNCYGLDAPDHYSSGLDVAKMARYAIRHPGLLEFTAIWIEYLREGKTLQANTNKLVRHYSGCDGLKTGWTNEAGHCLAATATRDGTRLIAVVLGAPDSNARFAETSGMLNAGFGAVTAIPLARRGEVVCQLLVERGTRGPIDLVVADDFGVVVPKGEQPQITRQIVTEDRVFAPVEKGQKVAELVIEGDGVEIGRCPLVAATDVPRAGLLQLMWKALAVLLGGGGR